MRLRPIHQPKEGIMNKLMLGMIIGGLLAGPFGFMVCAWLASCRRERQDRRP